MKQKHIPIVSVFVALLLTAAIACIVPEVVHNLGAIISFLGTCFGINGIEQYVEIFNQLQDAQIRIPFLLLLILCVLFAAVIYMLLVRYFGNKRKLYVLGSILLLFVIFFVMLILVFLLTEINSIRFYSALKALMNFI